MGYTKKTIEEMNCMDDFFMNAVAGDPEVGEAFCKRLLSVLLRREIGRITVRTQHALQGKDPKLKGIRIDVKVDEFSEEETTKATKVYAMEPHLKNDLNLPRHNRFYQARIDSRHLESGRTDYSRLPNLYVITILNFDPFGFDRMMYTIENHCVEEERLEYQDGLQFIYFYTGGTEGGSAEIRTVLRYLQHSSEENVVDDATREIHGYVSRVKVKPEVKQGIMEFGDYIWQITEETRRETTEKVEKETTVRVEKETTERVEKETAAKIGALTKRLLADGRQEDLLKAADDCAYLQKLLGDYGM